MPNSIAKTPAEQRKSVISLSPQKADTEGLHPYLNPGELDAIIHLVASVAPRTVIEFGCHAGTTAVAILRNVSSIEHYVGIEVGPGYVPMLPAQRGEAPPIPGKWALADARFFLVTRPRGSFDLTARDLPKCNAVFIDADHSRAGVLNDYALAKALTQAGGIIIFHDDNRLPVVQVSETLDELADAGAVIVHVDGTWLAYELISARP